MFQPSRVGNGLCSLILQLFEQALYQVPVHLEYLDPTADVLDVKVHLLRLCATVFSAPAYERPLGSHATHRGCRGPFAGRSFAADVYRGAPLGIRLCLPKHLVGYGGGVSLPEQYVAKQVDEGVALSPA